MALDWHERPEIFNKMVFIKCNYEVADWLLGESIIPFYANTYISSLLPQAACHIQK